MTASTDTADTLLASPFLWPLAAARSWSSLMNLAPQFLSQPINPGWTLGSVINITENNSSAPDTEREVLSHHSYGRQLGRIIDALGYSSAKVVEERVAIGYSVPGSGKIVWSLKRGQPTKAGFKNLCAAVALKEFDLHIKLNLGNADAIIYGADLTETYVEFNKGDVGDPASLGG